MKSAIIVGKSPFTVVFSIPIDEFDLKTLISRIMPYPESQIDEIPKRIFENWSTKLLKKNDIPVTPRNIRAESETAQNNAI